MKKLSNSIISRPRPTGGIELKMYNFLLELIRSQNPKDQKDEKKGDKPRRDSYAGIVNSMTKN